MQLKPSMPVLAALVALVAGAVYLPSLWGDFVYDDVSQIVIDDYIHQPSHLPEVITFRVMARDVLDFNRPVMLLSLCLDSLAWGRRPMGYHLTNLLLHMACTALVLLVLADVLRRLGSRAARPAWPRLGATLGALLFAVHPLNSEAVCPITFREDLLTALGTLVALWIAGHFPAKRYWSTAALGGGCLLATLAAVGAKETGAMVPPMLLAYWLLVRRGASWRPWLALIGLGAAVAAVFMAARFALEPQDSVVFFCKPSYLGGSLSNAMSIQPRIWFFQLAQIVWPGLLCADQTWYSVRWIDSLLAMQALVVLAVVVFFVGWRNQGIWLGAAWYALAVLPVSNLSPIYHPIADRYMYLPMLGVATVLGAIAARWGVPSRAWARAATGAVVLSTLGLLVYSSVQRALVWQTSLSLWQDTVSRNPRSSGGYDNLGFAYFDLGEYDKALDAFNMSYKLAFRLPPDQADPLAGMAITFDALGQEVRAEQALRAAAARDARYAQPRKLVQSLQWTPADAQRLQRVADRVMKESRD